MSVLEHRSSANGESALGLLHDQAERVNEELLPCRVHDPDLWFADAPDDVEYAKSLCLGCPVQHLCLSGALERQEPCGVWGGQLFFKGSVIARKRRPGRPRKDEAAA